jgi:uncharacterized RDD family membrane protein YckC
MSDDAFTGALLRRDVPRVAVAHRPAVAPAIALEAPSSPQVAVRARINAIILDLVLVGIASRLIGAVLGASVRSSDSLLLLLAIQFAYFFTCELQSGQTIGKRAFHVRVTTLSGATPSAKQLAIRNALRPFDALPLLYASGLISLTRTGPGRRQRIGDVAAGTTVVLDASGKPLGTPRWLLPVATMLTTLASIGFIIAVADNNETLAGSQPRGAWATVQGVNVKAGFIDGCSGGNSSRVAMCECLFNRVSSSPPYDTPAGFETLATTVERFQRTGNVADLPAVVVEGARDCRRQG